VSISFGVSGGTPPFEISFAGLPNGCNSENLTSFDCVPTSSGSFSVTASVTDAVGASATAMATLEVQTNSSARATHPSPSGGLLSGLGGEGGIFVVVGLAIAAVAALIFFKSGKARARIRTPRCTRAVNQAYRAPREVIADTPVRYPSDESSFVLKGTSPGTRIH
jgi:hypothetical protein